MVSDGAEVVEGCGSAGMPAIVCFSECYIARVRMGLEKEREKERRWSEGLQVNL